MNNQIIFKRNPQNNGYVMITNRGGNENCIYFYAGSTSITMCCLDESVFEDFTEHITQEEFNTELDKVFASIKSIAQTNC